MAYNVVDSAGRFRAGPYEKKAVADSARLRLQAEKREEKFRLAFAD